MRTWYFRYFQKTGYPSQYLLLVENVSKFNPPDFIFYPSLFTNKNFSTWSNVMLSLLVCIVYCSENRLEINITPYEENKYYLTYRDKI